MRLTRGRFSVRQMMIAVAISAAALVGLVLPYREFNYQMSLVEAEYYHYRAEKETNPALKAAYAELATKHERLRDYYRPGR